MSEYSIYVIDFSIEPNDDLLKKLTDDLEEAANIRKELFGPEE